MDLQTIHTHRTEAFAKFKAEHSVPLVLDQALEKSLSEFHTSPNPLDFEANPRRYFDDPRLIEFLCYDEHVDASGEEGDLFIVFAIWLKDSNALDKEPIVARTYINNGDDTCSPYSWCVVANNIDEYFQMLATGYLGCAEYDHHQTLTVDPAFFSQIAKPFSSLEQAIQVSQKTAAKYANEEWILGEDG
jgi:hypothetical protein